MSFIKNKKELSTSRLREQALDLAEAGIASVDPVNLMHESLLYGERVNTLRILNHDFDLLSGRIFVVGGGKAAGHMAEAFEQIVGADNITAGIVNSLSDKHATRKIKVNRAGHPLPDRAGVRGVEKMLALKEKYGINEKDLVVCLLSGGASALLSAPVRGISLSDNQKTTQLLIKSGADIRQINSVRKHLSLIKGGRLAQYFAPARVASFILSDVIGDRLDVIASGPTAPDTTTFKDVYYTLEKYQLTGKLPKKAMEYLRLGRDNKIQDTPKALANAHNFIIGSSKDALEGMSLAAKNMGLCPLIMDAEFDGDASSTAVEKIAEVFGEKYAGYNAFLFAGETVLALPKDHGKGGRNQHLAAACANAFKDNDREWAMVALSSDGRDYLAGVGGAIVGHETKTAISGKKIDIEGNLKKFESNKILKKIGNSLLEMDDTGTNIGDIIVVVVNS